MNDTEIDPAELPTLVERNGLTRLFANRVRAQVLVTLLYADEPLTPGEIASAAGVTDSAVHEALAPLSAFDLFETGDTGDAGDGGETTRYALAADDELVAAVERLARLATERRYPEA